ncbi:hypothetical protein ACNOYE_26815 [Nannocystaceae bacterium ST9]
MLFETVGEAISYAEPPDVLSGEYGDLGWQADGKPVRLVVKPSENQPSLIERLIGLQPTLEVEIRELDAPAEPEILRKALIGRLLGLKPDLVGMAEAMALDDLIDLVRESIHARLEEVRKFKWWRSRG